jgi:hypothetical protein
MTAGATAAEAALLNEGVGAEHCQKARLPPAGFDASGTSYCLFVQPLDVSINNQKQPTVASALHLWMAMLTGWCTTTSTAVATGTCWMATK